ncbi:MAG: hypothetical protein R3D98_11200 [Candidatus Krumholzibacteriia bacterium]
MLNKPKKAADPAPPAPPVEANPEPVGLTDDDLDDVEEELETVDAGAAKKPTGDGASGNIFMLNKKK